MRSRSTRRIHCAAGRTAAFTRVDGRSNCKAGPTCIVASVGLWALTGGPALAQLSSDDIAALRTRGEAEGWTFTVGENEATRRPLHELCGLVEPSDWRCGANFDLCAPKRDLPAAFDWRALNGCTPVKNQGGCGSCWAFGAIGAVESAILIQDSVTLDLSEQWLVSCTNAGGCSGGWHSAAFEYLCCGGWPDYCGDSGAVLESDFPYVAWDAPCDACPYPHDCCLDSWFYIGPESGEPTVNQMKQAILDHGPVAVCVYVSGAFHAYTGGVFNACQHRSINHCVVLVGWDDNRGTDGVWIMRNSWSADWGEGGYMRIEYGCSQIGYAAAYVNYPPPDCNGNTVPDDQDIANETSKDCNSNEIPDECEPGGTEDCNGNGVSDLCDIYSGTDRDCNENGVPDGCDIAGGASGDCNNNGRPDECEIPEITAYSNTLNIVDSFEDFPGTVIGDDLELTSGGLLQQVTFSIVNSSYSQTPLQSADIDILFFHGGHGTYIDGITYPGVTLNLAPGDHKILTYGNLDSLGIYLPESVTAAVKVSNNVGGNYIGQLLTDPPTIGSSLDAFYYDDGSGSDWYWFGGDPIANFYWEIVVGTPDCNGNSVPDACDIAAGTNNDVNSNGVPDECDPDCNHNGIPDDLDLSGGTRPDCNNNHVPDECELGEGIRPVIVQLPGGSERAVAQDFADIDLAIYNTKAWDDFTLVERASLITGQAFFTPGDWGGYYYIDFLVEIADAPGGSEAGANVALSTVGSGECGGIVSWDFGGATLPAGTWWISVQAGGGCYLDGQVYWYRANVSNPNGSEHYMHNPENGFNMGSDAAAGSLWCGTPADLAFIQNRTVDLDCNDNHIPDECESDSDGDNVIDDCDGCPDDPDKAQPGICGCGVPDHDIGDTDGDTVPNCLDTCPGFDDTQDADGDGVPNGCDACPGFDDGIDSDQDGVADVCETCPGVDDNLDADGDGVPYGCDLCFGFDDQQDSDGDGVPNGCDICPGFDDTVDSDRDGVPDDCDVCPGLNDQVDADGDGVPDCVAFKSSPYELDTDGDGTPDLLDDCPNDPNKVTPGLCGCGVADTDSDSDGVLDCEDNCPEQANPLQEDADLDGIGDACDPSPPTDGTAPGSTALTGGDNCGSGVVCGATGGTVFPLMFMGWGWMKAGVCRRRGYGWA